MRKSGKNKGIAKKEARKEAKEVLDALGIRGDKQHRYPFNLSGGEQQRVAIGRTLVTGAKAILADEPTVNPDEENSRRIMGILRGLAHEEGFCVIIVTHDIDIARASDAIWRIHDGRIHLEQGSY